MSGGDRRVLGLVSGLLLLGLAGPGAGAEGVPPTPAVDAADPGPSLPPVGRSLFDFLTIDRNGPGAAVQEVPFPFTALIARLERELDRSGDPPLQRVLIPLGRSLQRNAANPDFFAYPRAVVAVDGAPQPSGGSGMLLQDRLYIGYQERAAALEVISYNEAAGRFEFQLVGDYRDGGQPAVSYADRPTCVACHQNQAPIFGKPLWDETNANPAIAATLASLGDTFYGIKVERGIDLPDAFDAATDRANELALLQRVWQEGCAAPEDPKAASGCRADAARAVLRYRLAGNRLPSSGEGLVSTLAERWRSLWPGGLALPDGDLPNRVVLTAPLDARLPLSEADALRLSTVERRLEPFEPRPPREVWRWPEHAPRLVAGWARFLAPGDVQRLDALLWRRRAPTVSYRGGCRIRRAELPVTEYRFSCDPPIGEANGLALRGHVRIQDGAVRGGSISPLQLSGYPDLANLAIAGGELVRAGGEVALAVELAERSAGLHARLTDGNAIRRLEFAWRAADEALGRFDGRATATLARDFAPVEAALAALQEQGSEALSDRPLRRAALMAALLEQLGAEPIAWCCLDDAKMPPARLE